MGIVYRVRDDDTGTDIAVKTLGTREPDQLYRLKQEFRTLTSIAHPNLVELYELVVSDDECFFTMEFVEGVNFTQYNRGLRRGAGEARASISAHEWGTFLAAARQLVLGLSVVHAAGKLHRDVKPSNVLVTDTGRVVILDFGLATALGHDGVPDSLSAGAGTLAYMAPEQAWGSPPEPAADWYSVGVMLYETLTGRLPFDGPPARMLLAKTNSAPAPASALVPDLPKPLEALLTALLQANPARRPGLDGIIEALETALRQTAGDGRAGVPQPGREGSKHPTEVPFVGRAQEMARLHAAFEAARSGRAAVVHIFGPSGIGKTELVGRFLATVDREALVLRGRCHPQEVVPYKALDAVVDALSRRLMSLPPATAAALVPRHVAALIRVFPVLGRVPVLAERIERDEVAEPYEIRRRGFAALRELLAHMAEQQPLIMWIDDLQWGDLDSAQLLRDIIQTPDAPVMLLLFSYRSEDRENMPLLSSLGGESGDLPYARHHEMRLEPLSPAETQELAKELCAARADAEQDLASLVTESQGSPFFLAQLIHGVTAAAATGSAPAAAGPRLAAVLNERLARLPVPARRLLETVSVAARPLERSLALKAARVTERGLSLIVNLEQEHFLRATTVGSSTALEVYHDRIREVITQTLAADEARERHRHIAETLEGLPSPDPQELFTHYLGAGLEEPASRYAEQAADVAAQALAFDRAAELYRQVLGLRRDAALDWSLQLRLAEALANSGRGGEAGASFEAAAQALAKESPEREDVVAFRRRAAEQYLRSGYIDRGTALMRAVLAGLGVTLAQTNGRALMSSMAQRARLMLRRSRVVPAPADALPARVRLRLDALWAGSTGFMVSNSTVADSLGVRCLNEALDSRDRAQIVRALGMEAVREACLGGRFFQPRSARLLRLAEELARASEDPFSPAWARYCKGMAAYFWGHWQPACVESDAGVAMLREDCRGVAWEIVTGDSISITALAHMGDIHALSRRLPAAIRDGDQRGDIYAATSLRMGVPSILWLAQDRADELRQVAEQSIARWPNTTFLVQHYLHLISTVQAELYLGEGKAAWSRICAAWPKLRKSHILSTVAVARVELRYLRARAALAAALGEPAERAVAPWSSSELMRAAETEARRLTRELLPSAKAYAGVIRARIAFVRHRHAEASRLLTEAASAFDGAGMRLHGAAARYCNGELRGGDGGRALRADSETWMQQEGVRNPAVLVATLCGGPYWSTSGFSSLKLSITSC